VRSDQTSREPQPPRLAQWLATARLPDAQREFVLGDLDEEFQRAAAADGERAARRWYWHQAWRGAATGYAGTRQLPRVRRGALMSAVMQDVRYALRTFRRTPGSTAVVVLTLALGIGATTAIFSVADALVLRPSPYPQPEQLVRIGVRSPQTPTGDTTWVPMTYADMLSWQALSHIFSHVGASEGTSMHLMGDVEVESMSAAKVSPDYFQVYGVPPALGRFFTADDARPGAPPVMVLSHDYWRSKLNGDRTVIGGELRFLNGFATVIGVAPRSIANSSHREPLRTPADPTTVPVMSVIARMRDGITADVAQKALRDQAMGRAVAESRAVTALPFVQPFDGRSPSMVRRTVGILTGAVALVLLIACVNVAGLQFARGAARLHELAIRAAIGAERRRLIHQLLTETIVIAVVGGLVGSGLAWLVLDALVALLPVPLLGVQRAAEVDGAILAAAIALSVTVGLTVGLLPALRLSRTNPGAALGSPRVGHGPTLSRRGGQVLVGAEIALALTLLAGTALMIRSVGKLYAVDLGFRPESFLTLNVRPLSRADTTMSWFYPALLERVRTLPDVASAGAIGSGSRLVRQMGLEGGLPVASPAKSSFRTRDVLNLPAMRTVLPGYFEATGFRLLAGRFPSEWDRTAPVSVLVLSESVARQLSAGSSVVGRRVEIDVDEPVLHEVIGVVSDARRRGPRAPARAELYRMFRDTDASSTPLTIVARPRGSASDLAVALRVAAQGLGLRIRTPAISIGEPSFANAIAADRQRTLLLTVIGSLGLALALAGIFATTAYSVARRTPEIGVRMAMGAAPGQVVGEIVRDAAFPIAIGLAVGLIGALLSTRAIASFLFETTPHDSLALASATVALGLTGCLAAWLPARKAALVDPVTTLRSE
jgi:predicted permease